MSPMAGMGILIIWAAWWGRQLVVPGSQIAAASGSVSDGGVGFDHMGGLVGQADGSEITGSSASGNVSDGGVWG